MPIQVVKTKPGGSPPKKVEAAQVADSMADDEKESMYSLVEAYLLIVPDPSDDQIHALATAVGMDHETFEQFLYEILSKVVEEGRKLEASDADGALAEQDGEPDLEEAFGQKDDMKQASETDGGIDTEQLEDNLEHKDES